MTSSFSSKDVKKKKNNNTNKDLKNPLSCVNLEYLHPVDFAGRKYIPLTGVAEALGVDKHAVYNAASSSNRLVFPYTRTIPLEGEDKKPNSKKSIEVEGLSFLFDRLKKHVDKKVLSAVVDYVNSIVDEKNISTNVSESNVEHKPTIINFPDNAIDSKTDSKIDNMETPKTNELVKIEDEENVNNASNNNADNANKQIVNNNTVESIESFSLEDNLEDNLNYEQTTFDASTVNHNSFSDTNEMLVILDGILNILSEHSKLKEDVKALKNENSELKKELLTLKEEEQKLETESLNYINLKAENEKLKKELILANNTNTEILSKANMIKKYVLENKISM